MARITHPTPLFKTLYWLLLVALALFAAAGLYAVSPDIAEPIYRKVFLGSWVSWACAPIVWAALITMRMKLRVGWLLYVLSQVALFVVGLVLGQYGLSAIANVNLALAVWGWLSSGKPDPRIVELEKNLALANAQIANYRQVREYERELSDISIRLSEAQRSA